MRNAQPSKGSTHSPLPGIRWIKLDAIDTRHQVRQQMDREGLQQLADDIAAHGLLQPIIVRPHGERYIVIAGHRRRAACEMAGLSQVPAIVGDAEPDEVTEMQLAENLQREDLTPQEIGTQLLELYKKYESLDTVALIVNKSKPWVAKHIKISQSWRAQRWWEEGLSEDLELLNALDDLHCIDVDQAQALDKDLRAGKLTRDQVRAALAAAKAQRRTEQAERAQASTSRKPTKKRDRSIPQMCSELEWAKKPIKEVLASWNDKEREVFFAKCIEAWQEGRAIRAKADAATLTLAALVYEKRPFKLARFRGLLTKDDATNWDDVKDDFVRQLQKLADKHQA